MAHPFSAANFKPATASWPVFGVWSVERGPATLDTSEICSPEATVVKSFVTLQSPAFCAHGEVRKLVCVVFARLCTIYLDAAQRRLCTSAGGHTELHPAQVAQVCSSATQRRRYLVSHRLDYVVVLTAEKSVELR